MTRTRMVLAYIAQRPDGVSRAMVQRAFDFDRPTLSSVMGELVRSGMVVRHGPPRAGIYKPGRAPTLARYASDEERRQARRESVRRRRDTINAQNRARAAKRRQDTAKQAAREAQRLEREAAKARKQAERDAAKAKRLAERAKPAPNRRPERQQPTVKDRAPYQPREVAAAPVREVLPDSSSWLAANADRFERLPDGAVSAASRLRFQYARRA